MAAGANQRLTLREVDKSFGPVAAVRGVSFRVQPGVIHALVGENGAGKSTLVKMITGMEKPDRGEILLDGVPCHFETPLDARRNGITAVYQDPKLFPHLDVAENIFLGFQPLHPARDGGQARDVLRGLQAALGARRGHRPPLAAWQGDRSPRSSSSRSSARCALT